MIGVVGGIGPLHATACAARELAGGCRGAPNDRSDLIEGQIEHIVQHERDPLGGREGFEHDEQGEAD